MKIGFGALLSVVLLALVGCNSSEPVSEGALPPGPHRGTIVRLPDDKGFAEILNEPPVEDRRNPTPTAIVAYFLKSDSKTPLETMPTAVAFAMASGGRGSRGKQTTATQAIPLSPEPKSDDPSGTARFASKVGPYLLEAVRGTLSATIDGQKLDIQFSGGR
jgi:hypothetical protein